MTPGRSLARVYPNVNESFGRTWWDYDGLMVSWGVQEGYEVVRKGPFLRPSVPYRSRRSADTRQSDAGNIPKCLRVSRPCPRPSVSSRSSSPSRKRRSSARSRFCRTSPAVPTSSVSSTSCATPRYALRPRAPRPDDGAVQNAVHHLRVCRQYRFQGPVPPLHRLRRALLHPRAAQGARLLPFQGDHAPRREAPQRDDRS